MVNILKWDDSLSTGFDEVDLQHRKLILIIENVHECAESGPGEYALRMSKAIKQLTDYTQYHFTEEEALMRRNSFPGFERHKKEHDAFVAQVHAQIQGLSQAKGDDAFRFYRFLGNWLLAHIAKSDQEWAAYIKGIAGKK